MPPLEWSIFQSLLLDVAVPSFSVASIILLLTMAWTTNAIRRADAAKVAIICGLAAGIFRRELVPYWTIELGWYSLFSATFTATAVALLLEMAFRRRPNLAMETMVKLGITFVCAGWLTPWDEISTKPWIVVALALIIFANWLTFDSLAGFAYQQFVTLILSGVWCSSAACVLVLSHSGRFADLAILMSCSMAGVGIVQAMAHQPLTKILMVPAIFIPSLMLNGGLNTYSDVPLTSFVLIAAAPVPLAIMSFSRMRDRLKLSAVGIAIILMVPCFVGAVLAIQAEIFPTSK